MLNLALIGFWKREEWVKKRASVCRCEVRPHLSDCLLQIEVLRRNGANHYWAASLLQDIQSLSWTETINPFLLFRNWLSNLFGGLDEMATGLAETKITTVSWNGSFKFIENSLVWMLVCHVMLVDISVGRWQLLILIFESCVEIDLDISCFSQITFFLTLIWIPRLVVLSVWHFV